MARLRMQGVTADSEVPTPASGTATLFYNDTDGAYKVKYSNGTVQTLGSGGGGGDVASVNGKTGVVVLTKADVGLGNVDNTADLSKPISTATASALAAKYDASNPASYVDAAGAAAAAPVQSVSGQTGAVTLAKSDVGLSNVDNTSDADKPISDATATALSGKYDASNPAGYIDASGAPVQSVAGKTGTVALDKSDVGLGNVDNTSDADKPVSTATATALSGKYDASNPANYVDSTGAAAAAPVQSVAGKTGAVTLSKSDVGLANVDNTSDADKPVSDAMATALSGKYDASNPASYVDAAGAAAAAPVQSVAGKTGAVLLDKTDVGLGDVDNTSDLNKPISTATQSALDDLSVAVEDVATSLDDLTVYAEDLRTDLDLFVAPSGATRPSSPVVGQIFFDTSLSKPIFYSGTAWVDATGTVV